MRSGSLRDDALQHTRDWLRCRSDMLREMQLTDPKRATSCARCGEPIPLGPCFWIRRNDSGSLSEERKLLHFHPRCALDLDPVGALRAVDRTDFAFPGGPTVEALARQRVASVLDRAEQRWAYDMDPFGRMVEAKPPRTEPHDDSTTVAFARDSRGRPCVRVLCAGSVLRANSLHVAPLSQLLPTLTWASSSREYQFVLPSSRWALPDEDPARPFVATLFATRTDENSARLGTQHLVLWRSLGLPAPLLWIVGGPDDKTRDAFTLRARDALDQSGYAPDESQVVHSPKLTEEALNTLVAALDERFVHGDELREREEPYFATAALLWDTLGERRRERIDHILAATNIAGPVHSTRADSLIADSANWLIDRARFWDAAKLSTSLSKRDLSVFRRILLEELRGESCRYSLLWHIVPPLFQDEPTAPTQQLIDALVATKDLVRFDTIAKVMIQLRCPTAGRALYLALADVAKETGACAASARTLMQNEWLLKEVATSLSDRAFITATAPR